jgi:hypothetical protein
VSGWLKTGSAAKYCGISKRTFADWLKCGLRHSRLPTGTILIKREWIDDFLESFEVKADAGDAVDAIVEDVMKEFTKR